MSVVAGILYLGNICFIDNIDDEGCDFVSDVVKGVLVDCVVVLKFDVEKFECFFCMRRIVFVDEVIYKFFFVVVVTYSRDVFVKSLYFKLFDLFVD